jgi:hypothetical protein
MEPFELDECSVGTGATCGAMYLNDAFERLLRQKFGGSAKEILTEKRLAEASRNFETQIKTQFNPFEPGCEDEYEIPIPGVDHIPSLGVEGGFLTLSK